MPLVEIFAQLPKNNNYVMRPLHNHYFVIERSVSDVAISLNIISL